MFQPDLLGKFLQESFMEINALQTYRSEAPSTPVESVHTLMSLLLQNSHDGLLKLINHKSIHEEGIRMHPLDIIIYYIQRSPDEYRNVIFDALLNLKIALPLAINDHTYLETFQRHRNNSLRNEMIKKLCFMNFL